MANTERIPVVWTGDTDGANGGFAEMETEGLYRRFHVQVPAKPGLWCAWIAGEGDALRLGVLEPCGATASITRRCSLRSLSALGEISRCEIRPVETGSGWVSGEPYPETGNWEPSPKTENRTQFPKTESASPAGKPVPPSNFTLPASGWEPAADGPGALQTRFGNRRYLAFPRNPSGPFPLPGLFCFAHAREIDGRDYWVFAFDDRDRPVL